MQTWRAGCKCAGTQILDTHLGALDFVSKKMLMVSICLKKFKIPFYKIFAIVELLYCNTISYQ